jgi:hypothetical protein
MDRQCLHAANKVLLGTLLEAWRVALACARLEGMGGCFDR